MVIHDCTLLYSEKARHALSNSEGSLHPAEDSLTILWFFLMLNLPFDRQCIMSIGKLENSKKCPRPGSFGIPRTPHNNPIMLSQSTRQIIGNSNVRLQHVYRRLQNVHISGFWVRTSAYLFVFGSFFLLLLLWVAFRHHPTLDCSRRTLLITYI